MVYSLFVAMLVAPPSQADVDAWAEVYSHQVGAPPAQLAIKGVGAERTIAEFMDVCFRPRWNLDELQKAVKTSDFGYAERRVNNNPNSFSWSSKRAYLVVNLSPMFSQCALSIGSIQPRTGKQVLAMMRPAVEAELGKTVKEDDRRFSLEWTDANSGYVDRITLAGATKEPTQAIWYIFDETAPGVREKLDSLAPPSNSSSE